jgi:hypothetical protein
VSRSIKLITGIPRSGTTLCCKLINQRGEAIALHEPIEPAGLARNISAADTAVDIVSQINGLDNAITQGRPFPHGDKGGLAIGNPVGESLKDGIRQVVAKRGEMQLDARDASSYDLVVKQNALFTALISELSSRFPMICIVRNPVDVLLSWMTVDLPINRGHIPAGERFDPILRQKLAQQEACLSRQLTIYQWFIVKFLSSRLPIVRYEDVIASGGANLDKALGFSEMAREPLQSKQRTFSQDVLQQLDLAIPRLLDLDFAGLYCQEDILRARSVL